MSVDRPLWPGTRGPATGTPRRAAGSVRRTSTVDMLRPDGFGGDLVLVGRARDVVTPLDGDGVRVVDEVSMRAVVAVAGDRRVVSLSATPANAGLAPLVGVRASSGFRTALDEALPAIAPDGSALALLLDEVPVATLVSGSAMVRTPEFKAAIAAAPRDGRHPPIGICAGWIAGGAMATAAEPLVGEGPVVPSVEDRSDPDGWHAVDPLPPGSMRRRRRLDLSVSPDDPAVLVVDSLFRDTFVEPDGSESGVHEYGVVATVDRSSGVVTSIDATPHVLPGPDCPSAAGSALRLVGCSLTDVRRLVRESFTGTSTCTHLNDALRAMGDLGALAPLLESGSR